MPEPELPEQIPDIPLIGEVTVDIDRFEYIRQPDEGRIIFSGDVDREISTIHNLSERETTPMQAKLVLPPQNKEIERDGIVGEIEEAVTPPTAVFSMTYWMNERDGVGMIGYIRVDKEFQGRGIATLFKREEMEYMESKGIDLVYTDVVSEAGYRLARRTGFRPIHEADHLYAEETTLVFNSRSNTGVMFRYL